MVRRLALAATLIFLTGELRPTLADEKAAFDLFGDPLPEGALARFGTSRLRHGNGSTIAFSADGRKLVSFGAGRTIRTWDPVTGRLLDEKHLPPASYTPVSFLSRDAKLLAYQDTSDMSAFFLWDVEQHKLRHKLGLTESWWHNPAGFSPDGKTLVICLRSGKVHAWDVFTGQGRLLGQHKRGVYSLSFTSDGRAMTMSPDETIRFWDLKENRESFKFDLPDWAPQADVSPDGHTVVVLENAGKSLTFWDRTGTPAFAAKAPEIGPFHAPRFAPDGKSIFVGTERGVLNWDHVAGKALRTLPGGTSYNLTISPGGDRIAALHSSGPHPRGSAIFIWDFKTSKPHVANSRGAGHHGEVNGVALSPDGRVLASVASRNDLRLWDSASGRLLRRIELPNLTSHTLAFSANGQNLFVGASSAIDELDVASGKKVRSFALLEPLKAKRHLLRMHLSTDGENLSAIWQDLNRDSAEEESCPFTTWDVATGKLLRDDRLPVSAFGYGRFNDLGSKFLSSNGRLFSLANVKEFSRLRVEGLQTDAPVAFSPDGAFVAATLAKLTRLPNGQRYEVLAVQIWELATLQQVARLETGAVAHLAFTSDGRRLIAAGRDALMLWDLVSEKEAMRRPAPARFTGSYGPSFVSSLAVSSDRRRVATGHADTTILLWDMSPPAEQMVDRPVAQKELERSWQDLASKDARRAFLAGHELLKSPEQTLTLLGERLKPAQAPRAEEMRKLVADLEDPAFRVRDAAAKRLDLLPREAESVLRAAMPAKPSAELQRRLEKFFTKPALVDLAEDLQQLRAIRVLDQIDSPAVQPLLQVLAQGAPTAWRTRTAQETLQHRKRQSVTP